MASETKQLENSIPMRLQRSRGKGARLVSPDGRPVICCTRPLPWGNPFRVGGRFIMGDPDPSYRGAFGMTYCEVLPGIADDRATLIETVEQSIEWYERLTTRRSRDYSPIRNVHLACWCKLCAKHTGGKPLDELCPDCKPCHLDVLGKLIYSTPTPKAAT